jgi:hypothetical protein
MKIDSTEVHQILFISLDIYEYLGDYYLLNKISAMRSQQPR